MGHCKQRHRAVKTGPCELAFDSPLMRAFDGATDSAAKTSYLPSPLKLGRKGAERLRSGKAPRGLARSSTRAGFCRVARGGLWSLGMCGSLRLFGGCGSCRIGGLLQRARFFLQLLLQEGMLCLGQHQLVCGGPKIEACGVYCLRAKRQSVMHVTVVRRRAQIFGGAGGCLRIIIHTHTPTRPDDSTSVLFMS